MPATMIAITSHRDGNPVDQGQSVSLMRYINPVFFAGVHLSVKFVFEVARDSVVGAESIGQQLFDGEDHTGFRRS